MDPAKVFFTSTVVCYHRHSRSSEESMEFALVLLFFCLVALALPTPPSRPQIVYIPIETPAAEKGGQGCLGVAFIIAVLLLLQGAF
jgi:hypothetical protein